MTAQTQTTTIDDKKRNELIDISIQLGQGCWDVYSCSKIGFIRVFMMPTKDARRRAKKLFRCGFSDRMLFCPPTGIMKLDAINETLMGEQAWKNYLAIREGKTILDGPTYPDTPKVVLDYAKEFFLEGFSMGTIVMQEFLKM